MENNFLIQNKMKYVIYARKSSESEDRQAKSIEDQINTMKEIAKRDKIDILQIFQESKSAKEPGRPVFNEMIKYFEKGKFDGILCWKIDRLARNPKDEGTIKWMLQKGIIKVIKTNDRDYLPDDNALVASVEFGMATQYIKDLSKNVKRGMDAKVKRGEYSAGPPIGYLTEYKSRMMILDPSRAEYVRDAFRLYATEEYSVRSLTEKLYDLGLRSRDGRKLAHSAIHNILKNPIYYGYFQWKGQLHKGIHEPIISKDLFDNVQKLLLPKRDLKRKEKKHFIFKGFMHCTCGLRITAETKIKKNKKKTHHYIYYRCTKSKGVDQCSQKYFREEDLAIDIYENLNKFCFDEDVLNLIANVSRYGETKEKDYREGIKQKNNFLLERNKVRQKMLVEKYIDGKIPENLYEQTLKELREEEATLENNLGNVEESNQNVFEVIRLLAQFMKLANVLFQDGDGDIKEEVLSLISSNLIMENKKIACFQLKEPFNLLFEDIKNLKMPKDGYSELAPVSGALQKEKGAFAPVCPEKWTI